MAFFKALASLAFASRFALFGSQVTGDRFEERSLALLDRSAAKVTTEQRRLLM
jgi:hypothetical protein